MNIQCNRNTPLIALTKLPYPECSQQHVDGLSKLGVQCAVCHLLIQKHAQTAHSYTPADMHASSIELE